MKKLVACILVFFMIIGMGMFAQAAPDRVRGKILKEVPYKDSRGDNIVILSRSDRDGVTRSSDLYAYGYTNDGSSPSLSWKMYDYIHECPVDLTADFSGQSPIITDLDKNGISEVWLVYYIGCRGDISPDTMKIIMYEGNKKYALRGETYLAFDGTEMGGKYKADPAFDAAPAAFRQYADKLWQKYKRRDTLEEATPAADESDKGASTATRPLNEAEKRIVSTFSVFKTDGSYEATNVRFSDKIDNGNLVFALDKLSEDGYMHCSTIIDAEKGHVEYAWSRGTGDYGKGVGLVKDNAWIAEVSAGTESALLTFLKDGKFVGARRLSVAEATAIMDSGHKQLFSELLAVVSGQSKPLLTLDELKNNN